MKAMMAGTKELSLIVGVDLGVVVGFFDASR